MRYLEELLKDNSTNEKEVLYSQWIYDKKNYEDILGGVRDYFSHYTDHGVKHSQSILNNIIKMFKREEIAKLSSTDIWLLLEAAHLHDCGMYISVQEAKEIVNTEEFLDYFDSINKEPNNFLNEYTKPFKRENGHLLWKEKKEYSPEDEYSIKFIIAAFKRGEHAERSKDMIDQKSLLPSRLMSILGEIVNSHNYSFEMIEKKIPIKEKGIGLEDCHPRFISYLLRMGDLLDLDSNRISPTIIKNIRKIIPEDSKQHIYKHRAITHFRLDEEKIEVTATIEETDDNPEIKELLYNIYDVTSDWFDYISKEYNHQILNWEKVKPAYFNNTLPFLGELKIDLKGYEFIDNKNKPQFSVDPQNILELLKGAGIYSSKEDAIREILQNAVDATLLRAFLEEENKENLKEIGIEKQIELLNNRKINVRINKKGSTDLNNYWEIIIQDHGVGLEKKDFIFLEKAASSVNNKEKSKLVDKMPGWMRPSGNFGIGFQSVFLLTEHVELTSRSLKSNEIIKAKLFNPNGKRNGDIFFEKLDFDWTVPIGTELKLIFETSKISDRYFHNPEMKETRKTIENYDPLVDKEFDIEISYLLDKIEQFNKLSQIDIVVEKEGEGLSLDKLLSPNTFKNYEKYGVEIFLNHETNSNEFYFKGQLLKDENSSLWGNRSPGLYFHINITGYTAKEALQISRNKFKNGFLGKHGIDIIKAISYYIRDSKKNFDEKKWLKFKAGLFYQNYKKIIEDEISDFPNEYKEFYEEYKFNKNLKTFKEYLNEDEIIISIEQNLEKFTIYKINQIEIDKNRLNFIMDFLFVNGFYKNKIETEKTILTKVASKDDEEVEVDYTKSIKSRYFNRGRFYIPNLKEFKKLNLLEEKQYENKNHEWINFINTSNFTDLVFPHIRRNYCLFPFYLLEQKGNEEGIKYLWNEEIKKKYIDFVKEYKENDLLTEEEIEIEVDRFVEYLKVNYEIETSIS